ncbi:uncharacterized protein LOC131889891 [Tigriopus californicus]|uniref:uncharacterized protein LOC131889891 n=1 Tax=Tigriopus californicus TaxID=6832 RepID=UPI0027D9ED81|nr:uncharacterized protein LOC131889891 [Tigriopus californicus]
MACIIKDMIQSPLIGGGLGASTVSSECPKDFRYLSNGCYFPSTEIMPQVPFPDANQACLEQDQMLFHFTNQDQALVLNEFFATLFPNTSNVNIWLGIVRGAGSKWVSKRTMANVPYHQSYWASNEPSATGGDCAVADQALNFQWRSTPCSESHSHLCGPSQPPCPEGYEWVKKYGRSCFKLVERDFENAQGYRFGNVQILEDQCRQDGTRLAKAVNARQSQALVDWLNTREPWLSENTNAQIYLGMKWRGYNDTMLSKEFNQARFLRHFKAFTNDTGLPGSCFILTSNTTDGTLIHERCNYKNTRIQVLGLCQYEECITEDNQLCVFPFKYQGRQYDTCVTLGPKQSPWCSTQVDVNGVHIPGSWGNCSTSCSVNNCPIGFMRGFPDYACYKVSSPLVMKNHFESLP